MEATPCYDHLKVLITDAHIPKLTAQSVDTIDQVIARLGGKMIARPAIGILYEGARSIDATGGRSVGGSAELVFSLCLLTESNTLAPTERAPEASAILDALRKAIQGKVSPTGHKWAWVLEAPAAEKGNLLMWIQRWRTPAPTVG